MTQSQRRLRSRRLKVGARRLKVGVTVSLVLAFLLVVMLMPKSRRLIVTVDDAHRWSEVVAPPQRQIVWQPAFRVTIDSDTHRHAESHIRPQVTANGNVLYFTIRSPQNNLDIFRCQRTDLGWSTPQPVDELNSEADDVGPVIRKDGRVLYLYSDRAGGMGGMDLYVSRRESSGWTTPVNLGPKINSPVHEYDPAISPDAQRLFFSSNRSEQMHRQLAAGGYDPSKDHWSTTLRNDIGNRTFDLYTAGFDTKTNQWQHAAPLTWINTADHNEGAPFVSPDGAFLWFASDRPTDRNEPKNYDLYRSRLKRTDIAPENLGAGINTASNETEPCLSEAGFQLLFSRSIAPGAAQYALHQSTAKEIYRDADRDASNWHAISGAIGTGLRTFLDYLWLLVLGLAALIAMAWLLRQIKAHRVTISGFLLAALLIHVFLVTGSFFVFFQHRLTERLKRMLEQQVVATQVLFDSTSPNKAKQPSFESVADLEMPEPARPSDISPQSLDAPNPMPAIEFAKPRDVSNNDPLPTDDLHDPIVATVIVPDATEKFDVLPRSQPRRVQPSEHVRLQPTVGIESPTIPALVPMPIEVERQPSSEPSDPIETISLDPTGRPPVQITADTTELLPADSVTIIESNPSPTPLRRADPLRRAESTRDSDSTDVDTAVAMEPVLSVHAKNLPTPATQNVELDRKVEMELPAIKQPEPLALAHANEAAPKPTPQELLVPVIAEMAPIESEGSTSNPLMRHAAAARVLAEDDSPTATESIGSAMQKPNPDSDQPRWEVDFARKAVQATEIEVDALATPAGPAEVNATTAPTPLDAGHWSPIASRHDPSDLLDSFPEPSLARRASHRSRLYADASVNWRRLLLRRNLDEATKAEVVKQFGGNDETLATIRRGLSWIEQHQESDGHWGLHDFHDCCKDHKKCSGRGKTKSDSAGTALALLPFLGDGNTHLQGPYKETVARGITWLLKHQKPDGNLFTGGTGNAFMYSHGIAAIALCECYGMTGDERLRDPTQRAIDFIVAAQDPKSGGWRYKPRDSADTSVVGWQVMALKSAQMAQLNVPEKVFQESRRWLDSVAGEKNRIGQFGYQRGRFNPAMTAEAILCLQYMGDDRETETLTHGVDYLDKNLPRKGRETSYYWYYGTQVMFHFQGEHWQRWNNAVHPLLVDAQQKDGPLAGTWDPRDQWEKGGGRIYSTSLRILMLEVYYRHLPIYQVIE